LDSALNSPQAYTYRVGGEVESKANRGRTTFEIDQAMKAHKEGSMTILTLAARQMSLAAEGKTDAADQKAKKTKTHPADVIYLSGCQDIQFSTDATTEGGEASGALTQAIITSLCELNSCSSGFEGVSD
jgi:hypothetical protein